jgi:hypothetical protein
MRFPGKSRGLRKTETGQLEKAHPKPPHKDTTAPFLPRYLAPLWNNVGKITSISTTTLILKSFYFLFTADPAIFRDNEGRRGPKTGGRGQPQGQVEEGTAPERELRGLAKLHPQP